MFRSLKTTASCIALALAVSNAAIAADKMHIVSTPSASAQSSAGTGVNANPQSAEANAKVTNQTHEQVAEKRKQITTEALTAVSETKNALKALEEGRKDDALAALEQTTGKLELILARDPELTFAPTSINEITTSVMADTETVRQPP